MTDRLANILIAASKAKTMEEIHDSLAVLADEMESAEEGSEEARLLMDMSERVRLKGVIQLTKLHFNETT